MNWFQAAKSEMQTFFDVNEELSKGDHQNLCKGAIDGFHDL
jgi:hypothetical protein